MAWVALTNLRHSPIMERITCNHNGIQPATWRRPAKARMVDGKGCCTLLELKKAPIAYSARQGGEGKRLTLLDTLRGLALVSMMIYHLCYNLDGVFGVALPWFHSLGAWGWQLSISGTFLLVAGMCTQLSGKPMRRVLRTSLAALSVTLATWIFMPSQLVLFGILHCMAACQLVFAVAQRGLRRIPAWIGFLLCVFLYAATFHVVRGYIFFGRFAVFLPRSWYTSAGLSVLGFCAPNFYSADYFPLLPNLFLFLAGHYLGYGLTRLPQRVRSWSMPLATFLGRHSLPVYLAHQPIILFMLYLVLR